MVFNQTNISQLADQLKAIGHPLRVQLFLIIMAEKLVSIPTLQQYLSDIDRFIIYSHLRYMLKKQLVKKIRKGREIYYGPSDQLMMTGLVAFFQVKSGQLVKAKCSDRL